MPAAGVNRLLGDPFYYPIYDAAQERDVTISIHTGGIPQLDLRLRPSNRCRCFNTGRPDASDGPSHVQRRVRPLSQSTHSLLEAGSAWVLCMLERMQREYEHWGALVPHLKREPKEH
jgi:hypothetical protein